MYEHGNVLAMISYSFEEDPAGKRRNLKCLDIDIDAVLVPCYQADGIRDESCEETVEIEEECETTR